MYPRSHPSRSRVLGRRGSAVVALLAALAVSAPAGAVAATDPAPGQSSVEGELMLMIADGRPAAAGEDFSSEKVLAFVKVDGKVYDLPDAAAVAGLHNGDRVQVTLEAPRSLSALEALETAGEGASVVAVAEVAGTAELEPPMAEVGKGVHQLTVLPVYWGATDGATTAQLQGMAGVTEVYWERQSRGDLDLQPSVRGWAKIADPGWCDIEGILDAAMQAHGVSTFSATNHVAVYFPDTLGCDFAGIAQIEGGAILISGWTEPYVLAHEFGHNVGLGHANTLDCTNVPLAADCYYTEYGDNADVMGQGADWNDPGNLNTGFAHYLGYTRIHDFTNQPSEPSTVLLPPVAASTSTASVRSIRLATSEGPVYLTYRPAVGPDAKHEPTWAGVQAHLIDYDLDYGFPTSYLLDMQPTTATPFTSPQLKAGATFTAPGAGIMVKTVSTDANGAVMTIGNPDTTPPSAPVIWSPKAGATVSGEPVIRWDAATDAGGINRYEVYVDNTKRATVSGGTLAANVGAFFPGGHTVWVDAFDNSGNKTRSASVSFTLVADHTQKYITKIYVDLLDRQPDLDGLRTWSSALRSGTARNTVAIRITGSNEYRSKLVTAAYQEHLGRAPDAQGLATWVSRLRAGMTVQNMEAGFTASPEYFTKAGGTHEAWVRYLYTSVLGRAPGDAEVAEWTSRLNSGAWTRRAVALHFFNSVENLGNVVDELYQDLLGRSVDAVGRRTWVYDLKAGTQIETVIARIIGSNEYWNNAAL